MKANETTHSLLMVSLLGFCLMAAVPGVSRAAPIDYNFAYEFGSGEVLSGMLEGELQPDGDTILVSALSMVTFTGLPGAQFTTALGSGVATVSGLNMLLAAVPPFSQLSDLGGFQLPFDFGGFATLAVVVGPGGAFPIIEQYQPARWRIVPKASPVSSPATLGLTLLGVGLAMMRRRTIIASRQGS